MKYMVILGDGMSDRPLDGLSGMTPLEYAKTPMMDKLAAFSEIGLTRTIPDGMPPGSDTANLSVLGYCPRDYYTGRSPLEALSIGVPMKDTDIAMRTNIVTLAESDGAPFEELTIIDHSSSEIDTADAKILLEYAASRVKRPGYEFYCGTRYRHLLIWENGEVLPLSQPHDILGRKIGEYLPKDNVLLSMMKESYELLKAHPLNVERKRRGLNPANCFWFWGAGTKPILSGFTQKTGKRGAMISAVDLLKGIAVGAGMDNICVPGANGTLETNYEGKAAAGVDALVNKGYDFVYIHVEAPDEMGHQGSVERKIKAIENLDDRVIRPAVEGLEKAGVDFRLLVMPDHSTPICVRTHTSEPVPYMIYDSTQKKAGGLKYNEKDAAKTGIMIPDGWKTIDRLLEV